MDTKRVLNFNTTLLEDRHKPAQHKQPFSNYIYRECHHKSSQDSEYLKLPKETQENFIIANICKNSSFHSQSGINRVCQKGWVLLKDDMQSYFDGHLSSAYIKHSPSALASSEHSAYFKDIPSGNHRRNIVVAGVIMTSMFIAVSCLKNWQKSLSSGTLEGTFLISVSFIGCLLGSAVSVFILQNMQPRQLFIASLVSNIFNVFTNIFSATWLMAVISFIMSFTMACLLNSLTTYITLTSRYEVCRNKKQFSKASSHLFGLFFLIFHSHHIVSNLIINIPSYFGYFIVFNNATLLLNLEENMTDNVNTLPGSSSVIACGPDFSSESRAAGPELKNEAQSNYLLCTFYVTFLLLSTVITNCLLKPVSKCLCDTSDYPGPNWKLQIKYFGSFIMKRDFLLLLPLLIYSLMQFGFFAVDATLAYIVCPMGTVMLSYTMICFGICASMSSFISGTLSTYVGRVSLFTTAAVLNVLELLFISQWKPSADSVVPFFAMVGVWGTAHGIWISQVYYLMGVLFPEQYEDAYAGLRLAQGVGFVIVLTLSSILSLLARIYCMIFGCILALTLYISLEILLKRRSSHKVFTNDSSPTMVNKMLRPS
ncbi:hypothetical protein Btru_011597 [Bulinus truncatus]|nr:hypothetical protein Btru_011597 [Bulinus truncatus]